MSRAEEYSTSYSYHSGDPQSMAKQGLDDFAGGASRNPAHPFLISRIHEVDLALSMRYQNRARQSFGGPEEEIQSVVEATVSEGLSP
jgi:hypothetical protein